MDPTSTTAAAKETSPRVVNARSPSPTPSTFSLEVCVSDVTCQLPSPPLPSSLPDCTSFLLAFQLLQFDIVTFDEALLATRHHDQDQDTTTTSLASPWPASASHGHSCLFQACATRLASEIRGDAMTALVLLVLERSTETARLCAFASVPLRLPEHLATRTDTGQPRVNEWSSVEGAWPLQNHRNENVGLVRGDVTLSCLGSALAPHALAQLIPQRITSPIAPVNGSQLERATCPRIRDENTCKLASTPTATPLPATAAAPPPSPSPLPPSSPASPALLASPRQSDSLPQHHAYSMVDAAVQCYLLDGSVGSDGDADELADSVTPLGAIVVQGGRANHPRSRPALSPSPMALSRHCSCPKGVREPRYSSAWPPPLPSPSPSQSSLSPPAPAASFVPFRDLSPPPLYYHKPKI